MRGRFAALGVCLLAQGFAQIGLAQGEAPGVDLAFAAPRYAQVCTVAALDSVSMNFLCQTNRGVRQYWVARSTRFAGGWPGASFFDLTTGQRVQVTFHNSGTSFIADFVRPVA